MGDFAPKLVDVTDGVLFGDIWERNELSPRDRSLVTVASLITRGSTDQLRGYLVRAKANGLTETEPTRPSPSGLLRRMAKAMSAITVAKEIFAS
jgi:4-carboxymuconolactone decarboxylase